MLIHRGFTGHACRPHEKSGLPEELKTVVVEHYLNRDSFPEQKYRHCGCSRNTFYLRLHVAHQGIQDGLLRRAA
ncbi:hypothetical protein IPC1518_29685 [Pseudomonas aeruginosa]|nr:hypothetical protein IPC1518_29685 [Pseudomonas aeruginosa]